MILGQLCCETMRLEYISKVIQPLTIRGPQGLEIEGIAYDSRQVKPGYLFVALHGHQREGHDFVGDAVHRGAVAVVDNIGGQIEPLQQSLDRVLPDVLRLVEVVDSKVQTIGADVSELSEALMVALRLIPGVRKSSRKP